MPFFCTLIVNSNQLVITLFLTNCFAMMKKILSSALLVGGLVLLYFGYNEYQSLASEVDQFFGGSGSNNAIWMMAGGAAATIGGLVGLLRGKSG